MFADDDIFDVFDAGEEGLAADEALFSVMDDVAAAGGAVVALDGFEEFFEGDLKGGQLVGVGADFEGFVEAAVGVDFSDARDLSHEGDDPPFEKGTEFHGGVAFAADFELEDFPEGSGEGSEFRGAVTRGDAGGDIDETFGDQLAGAVDIGAVLEDDGDGGDTELGDAADFSDARESAHARFHGVGDVPFDFER